jgi:hypothetical protein
MFAPFYFSDYHGKGVSIAQLKPLQNILTIYIVKLLMIGIFANFLLSYAHLGELARIFYLASTTYCTWNILPQCMVCQLTW